jgi:hypothetical protein
MHEDDSAGLLQNNDLLSEQEDLGPLPMEMPDFDWRAPSPQHKDSPSPVASTPPGEQDRQHTPPSSDEDNPQEDNIDNDRLRNNEAALGKEVQPDDLPGDPTTGIWTI